MTYSVNGKIQASDINGFLNTNTPNLNNIWSTGSGNSGYGQTGVASVNIGDKIRATTWASLVNNITTIANHQGTVITATTTPSIGNIVTYLSQLSTNLSTVNTNRLNAQGQGSTTTNTVLRATSWSNAITFTFTVTFASQNAARYFFNAGGQLAINSNHPAGPGTSMNTLISEIANNMGTLWLSSPTSGMVSLSGISYSGVTKTGGAIGGGSTINTNYGFYNWTSTLTQVQLQRGNTYYQSYQNLTFGKVSVASAGNGVLTITVTFDEVPNGAIVSAGTTSTITVRPPTSTYLSNTWGTPTLIGSVSGT